MKTRLAMFDMDGTLYDTRAVNFCSYKKALERFDTDIEYDWFIKNCYGRHYRDFLRPVTDEIERVHELKISFYSEFIDRVRENTHLFNILEALRGEYYTALVTTASKSNTYEILRHFDRERCFDLIVTQDEVVNNKPDPEAYLYTMAHFGIEPENSIIFEDSATGIAAARASGAQLFIVSDFA